MSYCQECGSHIEQDINTCSNCGNRVSESGETIAALSEADQGDNSLKADSIALPPLDALGETEYPASISEANFKEPESVASEAKSYQNQVFKESGGGFIPQEGLSMGSHRTQNESHLGKGLIKPVAFENCMDGYHFRYDEPPRQITKPEPQKEKVVEFRFSGESEPGNEVKEVNEDLEVKKETPDKPDNLGVEFEEEQVVEPESIVEPEPKPESGAEENDGETTPIEELGLPENELLPEIDNPEPEIRSATEPEVIWEGHRTWNGLTLKEEYRITDQSIVLLGGDGQRLNEVEWQSVSGISLKQNWLLKLLNIGNLVILGLNSEPLLILEGIEHPERLQKMLVETICSKV